MFVPGAISCAGACTASHARASARKAASSTLSLKSISPPSGRSRLAAGLRLQQPVGPEAAIAEMHREHAFAPVIEMAIRLERIADRWGERRVGKECGSTSKSWWE